MAMVFRASLVSVLLAMGCGRIGYDPQGAEIDSGSDIDAGYSLVPQQVALPAGGHAIDIAVSPISDDVYVNLSWRGPFHSADGAASWQPCGRRSLFGFAIDGLVLGRVAIRAAEDVYISTDYCATWQASGLSPEAKALSFVGSTLYAATTDGIWVHQANSWSRFSSPFDGLEVKGLWVSADEQQLYLATRDGQLTYTGDGGSAWKPLPTLNLLVGAIVVDPLDATHVVLLRDVGPGNPTGSVLNSTDSGQNFQEVGDVGAFQASFDPADPQRLLVGQFHLLSSSGNGGTSLSGDIRNAAMEVGTAKDVAFDPKGSGIAYVAGARGVFKAASGGYDFQLQSEGINAWGIEHITQSPDGTTTYLGTATGVLRSIGGAAYTVHSKGMIAKSQSFAMVIPESDESILLVAGGDIWRSTDQGQNFSSAQNFSVGDGFESHSIASRGTRAYVGTARRLWLADDPFTTWSSRFIDGSSVFVHEVLVLDAADEILLATDQGLYHSIDAGTSFSPAALPNEDVLSLLRLSDGSLLAGTEGGVFASPLATGPWQAAGLEGIDARDILEIDGEVFVAGDSGLYHSTVGSQDWELVGGFADGGRVSRSLSRAPNGDLLVGTRGDGLLRASLP